MRHTLIRRQLLLLCLIAALAVGAITPAGIYIPGIQAETVQAAEYRSTKSPLNMRTGPGANYGKILVIPQGGRVQVISKPGSWYKVSYGGRTGYVNSKYLTAATSSGSIKATPASSSKKKYTKKTMAENLKMRSSMSKSANNVIMIIPKGAKVKILSKKSDNWYRIKYKGKKGYIKGGHFTDDRSRMGIGAVKPYQKVTRTSLNMRSTPSAANRSNIIRVIPKGGTVTVTEHEANNWYKVTYKGSTGYVKGGYFK